MDETSPQQQQQQPRSRKATRSSLACLPCRSRHLKCDGKKPQCSRCAEAEVEADLGLNTGEARECSYAQSRRGGLDRAALAERRKRLAAAESLSSIGLGNGNGNGNGNSQSQPQSQSQSQAPQRDDGSGNLDRGLLGHGSPSSFLGSNAFPPGTISPAAGSSSEPPQLQLDSIENDSLLRSYYSSFHRFHPVVLPHKHLARLYRRDPSIQASLHPLIAVLRLIGRIYKCKEWSIPLRDVVETSLAQTTSPTDPFTVQSRLLYSMVLFWHGHQAESRREMDIALSIVVDKSMFRREFAEEHSMGDAVLAESLRRTWWMVYIVDAYYAGTTGTMNMAVMHVDATADLPCEESEYESGDIPKPRTLDEFDSREFAPDDIHFSSFAYLVGAVRCAATAILSMPKVTTEESSAHVLQAADSGINAWLLLLPKDAKQVMTKGGEIDELMYQAHLVIHVSVIGLHRPLSDLKFNAVEDVSSCAREPPLDTPTPDLINIHTVQVLRSAEAQIRLLSLPVRPFHHSPFTTCMVSEGTLALLSACKFLLKGRELAVARDQIRLTVGCLKALGELWPRTARNVKEIQIIARHVLGLEGSKTGSSSVAATNTNTTNGTPATADSGPAIPETLCSVPSLSNGEDSSSLGSSEISTASTDQIFTTESIMDGVGGWYNNWTDSGPDFTWWMNNDS